MTERMSAGWYRDPFGRHEKRYHTGTGWTEHVKNKGKPGVDPPGGPISAEAPRRFPERLPTRVRRPAATATPVAPKPEAKRKTKPVTQSKPAARTKPAPRAKPDAPRVPVAQQPTPVAKAAPVIKADHEIKAAPVVKATPASKPAAAAAQSTPVPHKPTPGHKKPAPVAKSTPVQKSTPSAKPTPVRTPVPARANGAVRAGMPAASSTSVAVAPRPVNTRAPSAYLKPAPHMTAAPIVEHRPRWPWVVVSIFVLLGFAFASGVGLIDSSATEPRTAPAPLPSRTAHTINQVQYDFVVEGTTRERVVAGLGRKPADRADYLQIFPGAKVLSSCAYYYGKAITRSYSFCFDREDLLISKSARTLPTKSPKPTAAATSKAKTKASDSGSSAKAEAKANTKADAKATDAKADNTAAAKR